MKETHIIEGDYFTVEITVEAHGANAPIEENISISPRLLNIADDAVLVTPETAIAKIEEMIGELEYAIISIENHISFPTKTRVQRRVLTPVEAQEAIAEIFSDADITDPDLEAELATEATEVSPMAIFREVMERKAQMPDPRVVYSDLEAIDVNEAIKIARLKFHKESPEELIIPRSITRQKDPITGDYQTITKPNGDKIPLYTVMGESYPRKNKPRRDVFGS